MACCVPSPVTVTISVQDGGCPDPGVSGYGDSAQLTCNGYVAWAQDFCWHKPQRFRSCLLLLYLAYSSWYTSCIISLFLSCPRSNPIFKQKPKLSFKNKPSLLEDFCWVSMARGIKSELPNMFWPLFFLSYFYITSCSPNSTDMSFYTCVSAKPSKAPNRPGSLILGLSICFSH